MSAAGVTVASSSGAGAGSGRHRRRGLLAWQPSERRFKTAEGTGGWAHGGPHKISWHPVHYFCVNRKKGKGLGMTGRPGLAVTAGRQHGLHDVSRGKKSVLGRCWAGPAPVGVER